ncbi:MAG: hypothetical protein AABO41_00045 [Acidobacteriota bacterium]
MARVIGSATRRPAIARVVALGNDCESRHNAGVDKNRQAVQKSATGLRSAREYRNRNSEKRLETLLLEGINSGTPIKVTERYWTQKKAKLTRRLRG